MKNVTIKKTANKLTITVDLKKEIGPSRTGKTILVATTEGNQKIEGTDVTLGLNVFKPNPDR